jgi:SPX domain protein involved in polyphosphate accumulation
MGRPRLHKTSLPLISIYQIGDSTKKKEIKMARTIAQINLSIETQERWERVLKARRPGAQTMEEKESLERQILEVNTKLIRYGLELDEAEDAAKNIHQGESS